MLDTTTRIRLAAALAVGALGALTLSAPAMAKPDFGEVGGGSVAPCLGGEIRQTGFGDVCLPKTVDVGKARNSVVWPPVDVGEAKNSVVAPPAADMEPGSPTVLTDDGLEYVQIGVAALAGAAFTAAGLAAVGVRRRHDSPRPA